MAPLLSGVACHFGERCSRPNCRFTHGKIEKNSTADDVGKNAASVPEIPALPTGPVPWIPFGLYLELQDGALRAEEFPHENWSESEHQDPHNGGIYYELIASVFRIFDVTTRYIIMYVVNVHQSICRSNTISKL